MLSLVVGGCTWAQNRAKMPHVYVGGGHRLSYAPSVQCVVAWTIGEMSHLPGFLCVISLYWEHWKADTWKWGSSVVLKSGVFCSTSYCACRFRWCKTFTQNLLRWFQTKTKHSSVHAWPFITLLTTLYQMYFLVIIMSMERAGRFDLRRIFLCLGYKLSLMSGTEHVMAYEDLNSKATPSLILGDDNIS